MKRLSRFLALSQIEKILLVKAVFFLLVVRIELWVLPFSTLQSLVNKLLLSRSCSDVSIKQMIWSVEVASSYLPLMKTCLVKSIAAQILLTQYGYKPNLCIGVRKDEKMLDAHAWVEINGEVVIGQTDLLTDYVKLPNLQGAKP